MGSIPISEEFARKWEPTPRCTEGSLHYPVSDSLAAESDWSTSCRIHASSVSVIGLRGGRGSGTRLRKRTIDCRNSLLLPACPK